MFDLKIKVGHCDLYFMVHWFCLVSWRLFDVWTLLFGIMNQYDPRLDLETHVGHCDLYFMVQWFCLVSWWLFDVWTPLFGIMNQFDLKIIVGHCDLYFMVQWFWVISWRLIHVIRPNIVGTYRYWAPKYESRPTDRNSRYIWIPIFRFCQKLKLVFWSPQTLALSKFTTGSGNQTLLVFRNR